MEVVGNSPDSNSSEITVLLPMRNEEFFAREKIDSVIEEVSNHENVRILVIDSDSTDSTSKIASKTLEDSIIPKDRWFVSERQPPGKTHAINYALGLISSDFVIMMDADARCNPGWYETFMEVFLDRDVGLVCGVQKFDNSTSGFSNESTYKKYSNHRRIKQSEKSSIIISEGSICCFRIDSLGGNLLDNRYNADDTQISLMCIRNGFKCKMDPRISFVEEFKVSRRMDYSRRIRRGRGLAMALTKNLDLINPRVNNINPGFFFNTILLYLFAPWFVMLSMGSSFSICLYIFYK